MVAVGTSVSLKLGLEETDSCSSVGEGVTGVVGLKVGENVGALVVGEGLGISVGC